MRNMGGIMRAPSQGVDFEIPYSGTHARGDCILVISLEGGRPRSNAYYDGSRWVYEDYITGFSDENNVISFRTTRLADNGRAALIPGPSHV